MSGPSTNVLWSIRKGIQSLTLGSASVSAGVGASAEVTASWLGDGTLSAASSDAAVATVSVSGNTVTVTGRSVGGTSITVSVSEGARYFAGSATLNVSVGNYESIGIPSQSGALYYTGAGQSPSWNGFDSSKMTVSGVTSATPAGTYTAIFAPKPGYAWDDGTTEEKSVAWVIGKASPGLSVSLGTQSIEIGEVVSAAISQSGDGEVSAASSNADVASVAPGSGSAAITGISAGSAVITFSVAETDNYTGETVSLAVDVTVASGCTITTQRPIKVVYSDGSAFTVSIAAGERKKLSVQQNGMIVIVDKNPSYSPRLRGGTGTCSYVMQMLGAPSPNGTYYQAYIITGGGTFTWE